LSCELFQADHSGSETEGMKCFHPFVPGIMCSNPIRGTGVCVRLFCVYVPCVQAAVWSPSKGYKTNAARAQQRAAR
jgi:hypothetical protein